MKEWTAPTRHNSDGIPRKVSPPEHGQAAIVVYILISVLVALLMGSIIAASIDGCEEESQNTEVTCETEQYWPDSDGDDWGSSTAQSVRDCSRPSGYTCNHEDCDDGNSSVNPGTAEVCGNGLDDNCDGDVDSAYGSVEAYADEDGDGEGGDQEVHRTDLCAFPGSFVLTHTDCNDQDRTINSDAEEVLDGVDNDCDGAVDEGLYDSSLIGIRQNIGGSITLVGDQDGDGVADVLVGTSSLAQETAPAAAYLISGAKLVAHEAQAASFAAQATFSGAEEDTLGSIRVAALGDLDGDGFLDFALGAPESCSGGEGLCGGQMFLFYGRDSDAPFSGDQSLEEADLILEGTSDQGQLGRALASLGDLDGDGFLDFAVGAPLATSSEIAGGAVYIHYGTADPMVGYHTIRDMDVALTGHQSHQRFGISIVGVDLDQDGFSDLVVGAPGTVEDDLEVGAVYVIYGGPERLSGSFAAQDVAEVYLGDLAGAELGWSLHTADLDGDGSQDLAIGAPSAQTLDGGVGEVHLVFGGLERLGGNTVISEAADVLITASASTSGFGTTLSSGELDGDGILDLVIGAPDSTSAGELVGAVVSLYSSAQDLDDTPLLGNDSVVFTGISPTMQAGSAVACGDVTGDDVDDVLIGATGRTEDVGGAVLLIIN